MVYIVDAKGKSVRNATITARQISHDFLFGYAFPSWDISKQQPNEDTRAKFEQHFLALFNYATTENTLKWPSLERVEEVTREKSLSLTVKNFLNKEFHWMPSENRLTMTLSLPGPNRYLTRWTHWQKLEKIYT